MNYLEKLKLKAREHDSIICMGIDPVLDKIPINGNTEQVIVRFYTGILNILIKQNTKPAIVKPNIAFFEQYGFEGLRALKELVFRYQEAGIPVILDAKRADIGKTSTAYAKAIFDFWDADAVTINPYMGFDSIEPFLRYCDKGRGVYILLRTSNKGAKDFQDLQVGGAPLFMKVAEKVLEWYRPGIGVVVGATNIKELEKISRFFVSSGKKIPMLIPGVGTQGGSARDIANLLKKTNNPLEIHRINSSSGINYAYLRQDTDDYAGAAATAIMDLDKEIKLK